MRSGRGQARPRAAIITDRYGSASGALFIRYTMCSVLWVNVVVNKRGQPDGLPHTHVYALPNHLGLCRVDECLSCV